jgi:hypothetical protein
MFNTNEQMKAIVEAESVSVDLKEERESGKIAKTEYRMAEGAPIES